MLAAQTGRPLLLYDQTDKGADVYILDTSAAFTHKDYQPMTTLIEQALVLAQQH